MRQTKVMANYIKHYLTSLAFTQLRNSLKNVVVKLAKTGLFQHKNIPTFVGGGQQYSVSSGVHTRLTGNSSAAGRSRPWCV